MGKLITKAKILLNRETDQPDAALANELTIYDYFGGTKLLQTANIMDPDRPTDYAQGKFVALMAFRVDAGDTDLRGHLKQAKKRKIHFKPIKTNSLTSVAALRATR